MVFFFQNTLEIGKKVLLYNSHFHLCPGLLKSEWSGPFVVKNIYLHRVVEIENPKNANEFKEIGQRLKPFLENSISWETFLLFDPNYCGN